VLSGAAAERISNSKLLELVITDTIKPTPEVEAAHNIRVIPIGHLIGEAIARTAKEEAYRACLIKMSAACAGDEKFAP